MKGKKRRKIKGGNFFFFFFENLLSYDLILGVHFILGPTGNLEKGSWRKLGRIFKKNLHFCHVMSRLIMISSYFY